MRISDWSSDVCSSDLPRATNAGACDPGLPLSREHMGGNTSLFRPEAADNAVEILHGDIDLFHARADIDDAVGELGLGAAELAVAGHAGRSEEHPSEIQSQMRISYAVFCLKTKNIEE